MQGLRERREILRDQLERATNRRSELVGQLEGDEDRALSQEARAGIQQRLNVLDERIIQLERDQAMTERQLSNAPPDVLARAATESRAEESVVAQDDAVAWAFGTFGLGVLLTLLAGRVRRWRTGRRAGVAPAATALPHDPRLERLTQAVDVIAEEVERIGEGQRFVTQLLAQQRHEAPAPALRGEALGAEAERR
ncbi:MAG TPA: hypothetical protein VF771_19445 [Longimicrobiaceae bacterium]